MVRCPLLWLTLAAMAAVARPPMLSAQGRAERLAAALRSLDSRCLRGESPDDAARMVPRDQAARLLEATRRENESWAAVATLADWESFVEPRLRALRESLGAPLDREASPEVHVTRRLDGDGYRIENVLFEGRPRVWVAANLYVPDDRGDGATGTMPAIVIVHSHHNPKTQGELQDMGVSWARRGCVVLVPDMLGHGERRAHPFARQSDFAGSFRPGRQDYYFRYTTGVQLHLIGESLAGWMVQDIVRCVDVLRARPDVDPERIILIGSVAGGGDPAGVAAALDERIAAVAPFNFGGPQPDYRVPDDAESEFYWFGVPYWESTRCLRRGAAGGFAQWTIVASVAPRRLIYSHEFAWDRERDPAWPRIERVFALHGRRERLAVATGRGTLQGRPPESTHCSNVGPVHRAGIYPHLERWLAMPIPVEQSDRRDGDALRCWTEPAVAELRPEDFHAVVLAEGVEQLARIRTTIDTAAPERRRQLVQDAWRRVLGAVEPGAPTMPAAEREASSEELTVERLVVRTEPGIRVPALLLASPRSTGRRPAHVVVSRDGKAAVLARRAGELADRVAAGALVCLVDVRGTGETRATRSSGPHSEATTLSARELLLGGTLLGARVRDLRAVLAALRRRDDVDAGHISLLGDSPGAVNGPERAVDVPMRIDSEPAQADSLGALVVLLTALFEPDIESVETRGLLASWLSALESPFVHVAHDVLPPGALEAGDVSDIAAALAPTPLVVEQPVDARNRPATDDAIRRWFAPALAAYSDAGAAASLRLGLRGESEPGDSPPVLDDLLAPQNWVRDTDGPVISLGAPGAFDDTHVFAPCVAFENGVYSMWYPGSRGAVGERVFRLGLATSRDGRRFTKHPGGPVLAFDDDETSVLTPALLRSADGDVLRESGRLRLWFSATRFASGDGLHTLHESSSADGVHWSPPSPPLLADVYAPSVLRDGARYRMWYCDASADPWVLRHAESADGKDWRVTAAPVLTVDQGWERGRLFYPTVVKQRDTYLMWYGSYWTARPNATAIGFAASADGIHWRKSSANPVLRPDPDRPWESHYTTSQSMLRLDDGGWRIWYATRKAPPFTNKYFAISTARWAGRTLGDAR